MKYATWNLDFTDPNYGTGPEEEIFNKGGKLEGAWSNGQVENGATILGYLFGETNIDNLEKWNFKIISKEEALDFTKQINPNAFLNDNGYITILQEQDQL